MTCNITNPSIKENASDIKFSLRDSELKNTFIVGEKSKKLVLELNGPEMNGAHIYCQVYNPGFTRIDSKIINVEYAPQNVTNFSCVNHEWDVFLGCSWSHPIEYLNQSNIQVKSRWRSEYFTEYQDCNDSNYNYCNLSQGNFFSKRRMTISIEVKNTRLNVSTTEAFEFDTNKIVRPPPIKDVDYKILNSTCILLNWTNERPQRKKNVNVAYESEWQDQKGNVIYAIEDGDYAVRTVCGLLPYRNYTFVFTVYPEYDGYASESKIIITEKTQSSVPSHSPNTTGGALYYKTQECQQGKLRNVTIYWQPLVEKSWFGVPHGISIHYSKIGGLETIDTTVSWNALSFTMQLDCNFAYDINITAVNDAGPSFTPSVLSIPKYEPDFQPPKAKVEVPEDNTSQVYVSWNLASKLDQRKVEATIFWCKKSVGSICEGMVNWNKSSSDKSTQLITVASPNLYIFGVSLEIYTENTEENSRNTGLQWEECIYVKDIKPKLAPELALISTSEDRTLSVRWIRLPCQSNTPFINKYTVYYCKIQENMKCKDKPNHSYMQPEEDFLKLNNLEAEQKYGIWITASSEWGEGPTSGWVYGTPVDNNLTGGEIVGIVIGGLFVLVLAAAGAVFIIRYLKREKFTVPKIDVPETHIYSNLAMDDKDEKNETEKEDTIHSLPDGLIEKCNYKCMRQLSKDSGFAEEHKNRISEEEDEMGKEKEKELNTKMAALPQGYMRVEGLHFFDGSSPIHVPETTVGFVLLKTQSPQTEKILEPTGKVPDCVGDLECTSVKSDMKQDISSYIKCNSEPNNQHPVQEGSSDIICVNTHKLSEVPVQSKVDSKPSPELDGIGQPEAADYIPVVLHPKSTLTDSIAQSQPDVNNYVSNVTGPKPEQAVDMDHSVSNCITGNITPQTGSEGQSVVSDYVTSVSQPQQMCADRSTKGQPAVSGYVSNIMNSFPLSGNNNNHNQPALSNYVHNAINVEPAELNDKYQATQNNYIHDTTTMQQVSTDVNPYDQTPVNNYVTSVTNPQLGSE
ncbi:hypothetical protein CHS0354_022379 [Potamilus streckersoni]|uniref:Fibronectin type-III domain-containing protein n=1 Tax=Potamilus streckersoni TaxID=2493646 RepID=A0AAE0SY97_9BIVA|nr:hypothetical protein CHS0354_022379 [Potamilus streckersoni]